MFAALCALALQGAQFSDVPPGHWAYNAVLNMKNEGILSGYPEKKEFYFVFLVTGPTKPPPDENEVNAMQAAHIGNFKRRFAEGKLVAAGPLRYPDQTRRGIVVLSLKKGEKPLDMFEGDPYVENRILDVMAYPWEPVGEFGAPPDPDSIIEHRLITVNGLPSAADRVRMNSIFKAARRAGLVSVYGETPNQKSAVAFALSTSANDEAIKFAFRELPKSMQLGLVPLWMSKGTVK
jgi:uncharacterized protein YciI